MDEYAVVVAGAGPTGLMLAGELALAGVDVVVVERRTAQTVDGSRAGGLHARTLEVLDQRGIAERFIDRGQRHGSLGYAGALLDMSDLPTRHNYVLALWQSHFEPLLADWVAELGVPFLRGHEVLGVTQDDVGVAVEISGGVRLRAQYVVGCDGGRSVVRTAAGIDFAGLDPSTSWMIAEGELDGEPPFGFHHDEVGTHAVGPGDDGRVRLVLTERSLEHAGPPDLDDLREALLGIFGTDFGLRGVAWISRFTDVTRQATSYRRDRVLVAGDAAHIHPPQGGQGLNTGVQDAVNLGWKLAQVIDGTSPESLLDTYHAERHPVGARVLKSAMAQVALGGSDERHRALRDTLSELLTLDEPRHRLTSMLSGLDLHYDLGEGHPLLGRRMPDLDLDTREGHLRVFSLLHEARPVLLTFEAGDGDHLPGWEGRVRRVDARGAHQGGHHRGPGDRGGWVLPVIGEVPAPQAVLIRPDGYVAWVGDLADPSLLEALTTWCGSA